MNSDKYTISVVINTTDRADSLRTLLKALENQSYSQFEVVVVVGPTRDHTLDVLAEYKGRLRVCHCKRANLSESRNIGLLAARGEIVAYIDDDAVPSYHWLAQLARLFSDTAVAGTGGMVYMIHPAKPVVQHRIGIASSMAEQYDIRASWLEQLVPEKRGKYWVGRMMGTNMAFRRHALLDIGGFDQFFEWLYDDTDISMRLAYAGKIIHPVKEAVVYHVPASSRNRQARSFNARWWIQTKSVLYFVLKYGPGAGELRRDILMRCLHYTNGHLLWAGQLYRQKKLTRKQLWRMRREEIKSALVGGYYGFFKPRQLLNSAECAMKKKETLPIQPFNRQEAGPPPAIDPVSGRQPTITIPEKPLRICLLSHAYPPHQYEGVGRHTHLMAQGLFECGHTVHVITHGKKDVVSFYDGAYVHQVPRPDKYGRYRMFPKLYSMLNHSHAVYDKVKRLMLNDGIQVVDSPLWQIDGLVTAVSGSLPVIVRLQTALRQIAELQHDTQADARLVGELEQKLIEKADFLVPNSQVTLENVKTVYGVEPVYNQYQIIPHGIIPVPDEAIRPFNLEQPPKTLTVLYLGRLEKRKGIQDLFAAIPTVLNQIDHVHFVIAGADNSHRDGFQQRTGVTYADYFSRHYKNYRSSVSFLGRVSEKKLNELYQSCDLFVAPSLYESFGLIYLEAMNYAKPVVGCRAGGIPEVVAHGQTGLLANPGDALSLAQEMITLLQSPVKLFEMGVAGRQRLLEKFTHVQMARRFVSVYRQVVQQTLPQDGGA